MDRGVSRDPLPLDGLEEPRGFVGDVLDVSGENIALFVSVCDARRFGDSSIASDDSSSCVKSWSLWTTVSDILDVFVTRGRWASGNKRKRAMRLRGGVRKSFCAFATKGFKDEKV